MDVRTLLRRSARFHRDREAIVAGDRRISFGEAWRLAGPAMAVLMALMIAVVGGFIWMTVRTVRREREGK